MRLSSEVRGDTAVIERFGRIPEKARTSLRAEVNRQTLRVEDRAKRKVSGPVLNVRSGRLRRSIHSVVTATEAEIAGKVASSGDVKYAGIHEFGGQTRAHVIEAVNGSALRFMIGGQVMFRHSVNHPGSKMPERSYLRSSLREQKPEIESGLRRVVTEAIA